MAIKSFRYPLLLKSKRNRRTETKFHKLCKRAEFFSDFLSKKFDITEGVIKCHRVIHSAKFCVSLNIFIDWVKLIVNYNFNG